MSLKQSGNQTLLLVQKNPNQESRTFYDFKTLDKCIEFIVKTYEDQLRIERPDRITFTYDLSELYDYIEGIPEIICLVFAEETRTFAPHNKDWIKSKVYKFLNKQITPIQIPQ
ncbi:unnamed protein product [Blepharisma stoltei]|uniref:Enhancer of rudimentary homolog n=1 Tax=Blepharisma stoltei TaxID=1481888 RepID=A0AAU9KDN7_9CILI|nr:unnamed protein product [Blepharisma stoltei]